MIQSSVELFQFKEWLKEKRRLMDSSIYQYYSVLKLFFIEVDDREDIEQYNWFLAKYTHKRRSTHYFSAIKAYIRFKYQNDSKTREEWIDDLLKPKLYKTIKRERRHLEDEQLIRIVNELSSPKHRVIAFIQCFAPLRIGDVLSLRRDNATYEEYDGKRAMRLVVTGKGDKRIVVQIFDPVCQGIIQDYLDQYDKEALIINNLHIEDYVFITFENKCDSNDIFHEKWANYMRYWRDLKEATLKSGVVNPKLFSTHDFKRCFARKAWEKYKDIDLLKRVLNHENASTTFRYLRQSGLQNIDIFKEMQETP